MAHSIYEDLTRQIIEALMKGRLPWIRPWNTWPLRHNGRRFTGTNSLILCLPADEVGYRQAPAHADGSATTCSTPRKSKAFPRASYAAPERDEPDLQRAEQFFGAIGARIEEGGNTASYSRIKGPHLDAPARLVPPRRWLLRDAGPRTRSTGRDTRRALHGTSRAGFGDPDYAKEELVAELTAAYVLAANELPGIERCRSTVVRDVVAALRAEDRRTDPPSQEAGRKETKASPSHPMWLATASETAYGSGVAAGLKELARLPVSLRIRAPLGALGRCVTPFRISSRWTSWVWSHRWPTR